MGGGVMGGAVWLLLVPAGPLEFLKVVREQLLPLPHLLHRLEALVPPIAPGKLTETGPMAVAAREREREREREGEGGREDT